MLERCVSSATAWVIDQDHRGNRGAAENIKRYQPALPDPEVREPAARWSAWFWLWWPRKRILQIDPSARNVLSTCSTSADGDMLSENGGTSIHARTRRARIGRGRSFLTHCKQREIRQKKNWVSTCTNQNAMDIARPEIKRQKRRRQIIWASVAVIVLIGVTVGIARLKPAAPTVDRSTIWTDTVKRGSMLRQVRGLGSLIPSHRDVRQIPAETEATVIRIVKLPGSQVDPDTVLVEMSNPQLEQEALDAQLQVKAAQAEYQSLKVKLDSDLMNQKAGSGHRQRRVQRGAAAGADRQGALRSGRDLRAGRQGLRRQGPGDGHPQQD